MVIRNVVPGSTSRLAFVDHEESYGRHILERIIETKRIKRCVDIGFGGGADLSIISKRFPGAELFGVDCNLASLKRDFKIKEILLDIEKEALPFPSESIDFVVANQVFEHTKEIFWVNHEIFRCLSEGGFLFLGVPNLLSFHNRILMAFGRHPTTSKTISAHIRPFSKKDVMDFYGYVAKDFCKIRGFWGSQFYPFPKPIARFLSWISPGMSLCIFFLLQKTGRYDRQFVDWPQKARLETNFFLGSMNKSAVSG